MLPCLFFEIVFDFVVTFDVVICLVSTEEISKLCIELCLARLESPPKLFYDRCSFQGTVRVYCGLCLFGSATKIGRQLIQSHRAI